MFRRLAFYLLLPVLLLSAAPVFADPPPPPPNDNFADAMPLDTPSSVFVIEATPATTEINEPDCAASHTVWYTFTLDEDGTVIVYGDGINALPPTTLTIGVYRAGDSLTEVLCAEFDYEAERLYALAKKKLTAGKYYIQAGMRGEPPPFDFAYFLMFQFTPENDDFADAAVLTPAGDRTSAVLATTEAGSDSQGMGGCGGRLYHTLWYKFKLAVPTTIDLTLNGNLFTSYHGQDYVNKYFYIDLWRKSGAGRTPLACDNDGSGNLRRTLSPGTYYVRLASEVSVVKRFPSDYHLTAVFEPPGMPVIYDQPDNLIIIDGESATFSVRASSSLPLTYQWYQIAGLQDAGDTSNPVAGATGPVLTTGALGVGYAKYWVRVSNAVGVRDSEPGYVHVSAVTPRTELIENGGFEAGISGWTLRNSTSDDVKCGSESKPPQGDGSPCAFVFKGGAGENAVLEQFHTLISYDIPRLEFSFMMKNTGAAGKLHVKFRVTYADYPDQVFKFAFKPNGAYTRLWTNGVTLGSNADGVWIRFLHGSTGGKTLIDDVSLIHTSYDFSGRQRDVLPPPSAPAGFRSGD